MNMNELFRALNEKARALGIKITGSYYIPLGMIEYTTKCGCRLIEDRFEGDHKLYLRCDEHEKKAGTQTIDKTNRGSFDEIQGSYMSQV